ncbi:MAG: HPF/RaiA family ribosome-associated protein [Dehalococcoidia bacterium]
MQIQVKSDHTIKVDARVTHFVEREVGRILEHVADRLTRLQVHLSDVNSRKVGPADKRCVVEARPAGSRPLSTHASADNLPLAVDKALRKMQRALKTFFDRQGWTEGKAAAKRATSRKVAAIAPPAAATRAGKTAKTTTTTKATKATTTTRPKAAKASGAAEPATVPTSGRSPKKKRIFQARRQAWPTR